MNDLYGIREDGFRNSVSWPLMVTEEQLRKALLRIFDPAFNPTDEICPELFKAIDQLLRSGIGEAMAKYDNLPKALVDKVMLNADVFSAFKVHRAQNDMARLLRTDDGGLRSFKEWSDLVQPIASHHVGAWLRTEYDTAVLRSEQAAQWQQFLDEADVLPNLEWIPSTSVTPGADHQVFWGTILPVNDPFWNEHRPGDRWNCKCTLQATDKAVVPPPIDQSKANDPQPGLDKNPGKDGEIFSKTHPYIANAYQGADDAVQKFIEQL